MAVPAEKNVDFLVIFEQEHRFVQVFVPEKLHSVLDGFFVQLADVLRHPHGAVVFSKGKIEIHLALLLVEIFQFTHKILLEVIKAGKTQLFAKAQDGRRRGVGHFCQTAGGIFGNFHPMRQNIGGQRFFPFRKFFLKRKFVHDQHCDSPFRFFCKHIISCSIWQKNLRHAKTPPRQQMTRRRRYSGRSAYLPSISWAVLQMVAASRP